jgi:hypothetical protein
MRTIVVRIDRRRVHRVARRMHAQGWPRCQIRQALGIPQRRLSAILAGNDVWGADLGALVRAELARLEVAA